MYSNDPNGLDSGAPRRILGMKIWQAALLMVMAAMDCLVIVVGAAILIGPMLANLGGNGVAGSLTTPSPAAGTSLAPLASQTPVTMLFQFPTYTPYGTPAISPTPEDWMTGWTKFTMPEVEIWMPDSYAAGDPHSDSEAIIAALQEKGANYNWDYLLEQMTNAEDDYVLWGLDSYQGNPDILTNVAVIYDKLQRGESLSDYADRKTSGDSDLIERSEFLHPLYKIERLILKAKDPESESMRFALYVVNGKKFVWTIFCATGTDELDDRLPEFDKIAGSFQVLAEPE